MHCRIPLMLLADHRVRAAGIKIRCGMARGADEIFRRLTCSRKAMNPDFWARAPGSRWRPL